MDKQSILSREIRLPAPWGLSLREAARLVQEANHFECNVSAVCGGLRADAKSIIGMSCLPMGKSASLLLESCGKDAAECLEALQGLVQNFLEGGREAYR